MKFNFFKKFDLPIDTIVPNILILILLSLFLLSHLRPLSNNQQFVQLAASFLDGSLSFTAEHMPALPDLAFYQGKYFWPLGPFPAIILVPGVWLGDILGFVFYQAYLQLPLVLAIFWLVYRLTRRLNFSEADSRYLVFAFVGASAFFDLALFAFSWWFAQVVAVFFLLLALVEFYEKKRWWLIGVSMALAAATRITTTPGIIFFILMLITEPFPWSIKIKSLFKLVGPLVVVGLMLAIYNFLRFNNFAESGYSYQIVHEALVKARDYGLSGLVHLPGHLYYLFLAPPLLVFKDSISHVLKPPYFLPDPWGMSIFITSPYYLSLFFSSLSTRQVKFLWSTVIAIAVPLLCLFVGGVVQIGYRYALDFIPFLFVLFLLHIKNTTGAISTSMKIVFVLSFLVNFYFSLALRHPWP